MAAKEKNTRYNRGLLLMLLLAFLGTVVLLGFTTHKHNHQICSALYLNITNAEDLRFIDGSDVSSVIHKYVDIEPIGTEIYEQDLHAIENELNRNPFVKNAEVYFDNTGGLHVEVLQRRPILRIINSENVSYYIDSEGFKAPLSSKFTCRVPIMSGFIHDNGKVDGAVERTSMLAIYEFAKYIDENTFWNAQIEQIHLDKDAEAILIPKVGDHEILFGTIENVEEKFDKVFTFYKEGLSRLGWEKYEGIDVRFDNQVVAIKKES